jgi:hypothetical protein
MDKSKLYGFDLPKGTWMIAMKVDNDETWAKVKSGELKGFSIEGYFAERYEMSAEEFIDLAREKVVQIIKSYK